MQVTIHLASIAPETFEMHRCGSADGAAAALLCLSTDAAEFIDAALDALQPGASGGACRVDQALWEESLSAPTASPSRLVLYSAGIRAVQAHCVGRYGVRFQHLARPLRGEVLATLADGSGFGGIASFQCLAAMLRADLRHDRPRGRG